ncbi:hypothetical protein [Streptomyces lanatus]|uniref:Uncharacterized protein n=1 Tax=Streptomyces lanatus TaxID=66900 RepID=A0ABV1XV97_9ACTN|nr:hypothetical protein [Streptomyces lanatus]
MRVIEGDYIAADDEWDEAAWVWRQTEARCRPWRTAVLWSACSAACTT